MNKDELVEELERMINACDKTGLADFQAVIIKRSTAEAILKQLKELDKGEEHEEYGKGCSDV